MISGGLGERTADGERGRSVKPKVGIYSLIDIGGSSCITLFNSHHADIKVQEMIAVLPTWISTSREAPFGVH